MLGLPGACSHVTVASVPPSPKSMPTYLFLPGHFIFSPHALEACIFIFPHHALPPLPPSPFGIVVFFLPPPLPEEHCCLPQTVCQGWAGLGAASREILLLPKECCLLPHAAYWGLGTKHDMEWTLCLESSGSSKVAARAL